MVWCASAFRRRPLALLERLLHRRVAMNPVGIHDAAAGLVGGGALVRGPADQPRRRRRDHPRSQPGGGLVGLSPTPTRGALRATDTGSPLLRGGLVSGVD